MFTKNIKYKNFTKKKSSQKNKILKKFFKDSSLIEKYPLLNSLTEKFQYSYKKKKIKEFLHYKDVNLIGIGGSILGAEAIYDFLKHKVKKNFSFYNNIKFQKIRKTNKKKN